MTEILKKYPYIIGQKETHFTTDPIRAERYTGKTREVDINGYTVYILTGLSSKAKWQSIEKTCQLAGISFEIDGETQPLTKPVQKSKENPAVSVAVNNSETADSVRLEDIIDDYIEIIQRGLEDVLYKSDNAQKYYDNLLQNKRDCLGKYYSSGILDVECEFIDEYSNEKTDILIDELERYAQKRNKLALYYMSIWYASGFIGVRSIGDSQELYILKPDIKKANDYRKSSARKGYAQAYYAQACYLMSKSCNNEDVIRYFEEAKKRGCKNAEIMLRYFNQPKKDVIYSYCIPCQDAGGKRTPRAEPYTYLNYAQWSCDCSDRAIYEYNGYFYYMR